MTETSALFRELCQKLCHSRMVATGERRKPAVFVDVPARTAAWAPSGVVLQAKGCGFERRPPLRCK
jgi:hypothetical protein